MRVFIQGLSALAHYRSAYAQTEVEHLGRSIRRLDEATSSIALIRTTRIYRTGVGDISKDNPLHVLVANKAQRSGSKLVHARVWGGPIAGTAFRRIDDELFVSSPEFVFLQMATQLDLPELVALGMELCGTYRRDVVVPELGSDELQLVTAYDEPPLSTPRRLASFVSAMNGAPGSKRAQKALEYVLANSASPMETALYLLLCLPRRLGGYGLPKPELNPPIHFTKAGRRHTTRRSAAADLYWRGAKLDLEFNSDEFHTEETRTADSMRRKAIEVKKIEVIELTTKEVFSEQLLHATVLRVASRLGRRIRSEQEGSFMQKRAQLRGRLLPQRSEQERAGETGAENQRRNESEAFPDDEAYDDSYDESYYEGVDDEGADDMTYVDEDAPDSDSYSWEDKAFEGIHVIGGARSDDEAEVPRS